MQFARIQVVLSRSTLTLTECGLLITRLAIPSVPGKQRSEPRSRHPPLPLTAQALAVMGIEPSGRRGSVSDSTVLRRRDPFDASLRRVMHRTQIKGEARVG